MSGRSGRDLDRIRELVVTYEEERHGDRDQCDRAANPERPLQPTRERGGSRFTLMLQNLHVRSRHRGGDRDADCTAELLRRVEQPRGEPGLAFRDARERGDRDGDERERRTEPVTKNGPNRLLQ